jgi:hypothetical protein
MGLLNIRRIYDFFTNNHTTKQDVNGNDYIEHSPVKYRWSHGATDKHLGDGLLIYSMIHHLRAKTCVCLGSGGGFIPRIMTEARMDLHDADIFEGKKLIEWGDVGTTILIDADNGVGGDTDGYLEKDSFFRYYFPIRVIRDTTENAFYNFIVKEDIKIDYLHIDAGHSYEDVKRDFELYTKHLNPWGIVSIHDTDVGYEKEYIVTDDIKDQNHHRDFNGPQQFIRELNNKPGWELFNFFNHGIKRDKPSTTGLTILQKCKI